MGNYGKDCEVEHNNCDTNNIGNAIKSCFFSLPPAQFSLLSSIVGILLIDNLDLNQQNSLGNFLVGVAQAILTAAAQGSTLESSEQKNDRISKQIRLLKKQIFELEEELKKRS